MNSPVLEALEAFHLYEAALVANDLSAMDAWFEDRPDLVRFGIAEVQHGLKEVSAWRATALAVPKTRRHERVTAVQLCASVVVVALEFRNGEEPRLGRQTQVWCNTDGGWKIAHAHVSVIDG